MVEEEQVARWVVGLEEGAQADNQTQQFLDAARLAWPHVLAHTRRELSGRHLSPGEVTSAAFEVWEEVLRSVWGTLRRHPDAFCQIRNMENYLVGIFHHRLNRRVKHGRSRDTVLEFLPPEELESLKALGNIDEGYSTRLHQNIQMDKVYAQLDEKVRNALIARIYGFSWSEIAQHFQIEEQNLIMRVRYAIRKVKESLTKRRGIGSGTQ